MDQPGLPRLSIHCRRWAPVGHPSAPLRKRQRGAACESADDSPPESFPCQGRINRDASKLNAFGAPRRARTAPRELNHQIRQGARRRRQRCDVGVGPVLGAQFLNVAELDGALRARFNAKRVLPLLKATETTVALHHLPRLLVENRRMVRTGRSAGAAADGLAVASPLERLV